MLRFCHDKMFFSGISYTYIYSKPYQTLLSLKLWTVVLSYSLQSIQNPTFGMFLKFANLRLAPFSSILYNIHHFSPQSSISCRLPSYLITDDIVHIQNVKMMLLAVIQGNIKPGFGLNYFLYHLIYKVL